MKGTRLCEVLVIAAPDIAGITDEAITTSCPSCNATFTLGSCAFQAAPEPTYRCPRCQTVVLTIGRPGCGRGTRLNDYVLINERDVTVAIGTGIVFTASRPMRDKLS